MTTPTDKLVERLRADADAQDDEDESVVSTNAMRNAATTIEALTERLAQAEAALRELVKGARAVAEHSGIDFDAEAKANPQSAVGKALSALNPTEEPQI